MNFTHMEDIEANTFAMCFLMPEHLFIPSVNKHTNSEGYVDIDSVAKEFKVDRGTALERAYMLGLLIRGDYR